ncbi:hypothetical protein niasHS_002263 [Heterodera schachtii]|uniref:Uncharacterized protein n=1 Tax=Heterodera schachtii TaxID=97005 RepID=A0ABD2KMR4_HETSC
MKYTKRVFAMDERELRAVLALVRGRELAKADKQTMQEEVVGWLLSEGLTARHEFLLFKKDAEESGGRAEVWPLMSSRRTTGTATADGGRDNGKCGCCGGREETKEGGQEGGGERRDSLCPPFVPSLSSAVRSVPPPRPPPPFVLQQNKVTDSSASKKVIVVQPMREENGKKMVKKSSTPQRECCVECGQFCVDFLSTLK